MRLNPSNPTEPSITATKAIVPGRGSRRPASPVAGTRTIASRRPSSLARTPSGAIRDRSSK